MAKLVEILALEMEEWPEGVTHLTQSNVDLEIYNALDGKDEDSLASLEPRFDTIKSNDERGKYPIVTRAQWQVERDKQKGGEWKRHRAGRNQPVMAGVRVEVKLRCGDIQQGNAHEFIWLHSECDAAANIMSYRVISQPQAEEVEVNKFCMGENCNATAESILHSHECEAEHEAAYTGLWAQSTGPLAWRDTIIHCQAIIEDCEREIERNVALLDSEGLFMQLNAKNGMQAYDVRTEVDVSDYRNWVVGSPVVVGGNFGSYGADHFEKGSEVTDVDLEDSECPIAINGLWFTQSELKTDVTHA